MKVYKWYKYENNRPIRTYTELDLNKNIIDINKYDTIKRPIGINIICWVFRVLAVISMLITILLVVTGLGGIITSTDTNYKMLGLGIVSMMFTYIY